MGRRVVHLEIIGRDPAKLRSYYVELFEWEFSTGDATTEAISEGGNYGFVDVSTTGGGINGGVGGGEGYRGRVLFYVSVPKTPPAARRKAIPAATEPGHKQGSGDARGKWVCRLLHEGCSLRANVTRLEQSEVSL